MTAVQWLRWLGLGSAGAGLTQGTNGNRGQARARVRQVVTGGNAGCNQGSATGVSEAKEGKKMK